MNRAARVTRCTAVVTTLAAGVLGALAWAAPAQAAGVETAHSGTFDFVWATAPGGNPRTPDDFVWPVAPGHDGAGDQRTPGDFVWLVAPGHGAGDGSRTPDDFVWPAPPAAS